jgi:release factor glutamine methyltransferase
VNTAPPADPGAHRRRRVLDEAVGVLTSAGVASPRVDAELLLTFVWGIERGRLIAYETVPTAVVADFGELIRRRAAREPLQHLTGRAPFRHVEIEVGPGVFVPRPETEAMAGWVIDRLTEIAVVRRPVVVELCAGSAAISMAILDEVSDVQVHAIELDDGAYRWAARNLAGTGAALALGDMADTGSIWPQLLGTCDVVVANPPYIPMEAWESVPPEVRDHDPALALWSGADGLAATAVVARVAAQLLRPGGLVASEHAEVQAQSAPEVFVSNGSFDQVRDHLDLAGRARFVTGRRI